MLQPSQWGDQDLHQLNCWHKSEQLWCKAVRPRKGYSGSLLSWSLSSQVCPTPSTLPVPISSSSPLFHPPTTLNNPCAAQQSTIPAAFLWTTALVAWCRQPHGCCLLWSHCKCYSASLILGAYTAVAASAEPKSRTALCFCFELISQWNFQKLDLCQGQTGEGLTEDHMSIGTPIGWKKLNCQKYLAKYSM